MELGFNLFFFTTEPVTDKKSDFYYIVSNGDIKFKPYYIAYTKIQTLALLDDKYKGSNWLHWRRGRDSFFRLTSFAAETQTPSHMLGPSFRIQKTCTNGMFPLFDSDVLGV